MGSIYENINYIIRKRYNPDNNFYDIDSGTTYLMEMCRRGDIDFVKKLIKAKANVNAKNKDGVTSLGFACVNGHIDIAELLIKNGADINSAEMPPLTGACVGGHIDIVKFLIDNGANVNVIDKNGCTPLRTACEDGHIDIIKLLIRNGADVNAKDKNGWTPLMTAYENGHLDIVELLIRNGADVNAKDKNGWTPLGLACRDGHIDIVKLLINNGADVNAQNNEGDSPLHLACLYGHVDIAELLIENNADINIRNTDGHSALDITCMKGELNLVKLLVENGAKIDFALYFANVNGFKNIEKYLEEKLKPFRVVDFLIENGMDVDSVSERKDKVTHLMEMCNIGSIEYVEKLVDAGADVNAKDANGQTPLFWAIKSGNVPIIKFLISKGADINVKNKKGSTLVDFALSIGNLGIARVLKEKTSKSETVAQKQINNQSQQIQKKDTDNLGFSTSEYLKCSTVLTKILTLYGKEILQEKNQQKFSSLVSDFFERDTDLARVVKVAIGTGFCKLLFDADSESENQQKTAIDKSIKMITAETDIVEDNAKKLLEVFVAALEWNIETE